jgi:hypothetical protein
VRAVMVEYQHTALILEAVAAVENSLKIPLR